MKVLIACEESQTVCKAFRGRNGYFNRLEIEAIESPGQPGREGDNMKYFISQAMNGRTDEAIKAERAKVIAAMKKENPEAEVIDSFFEGAPHDAKPLWFLGKSFELLSTADMCVFVDYAADTARGCALEYRACLAYGIDCCQFDTETGAFVATARGG